MLPLLMMLAQVSDATVVHVSCTRNAGAAQETVGMSFDFRNQKVRIVSPFRKLSAL